MKNVAFLILLFIARVLPAQVNLDFESSLGAPVSASTQVAGWTILRGLTSSLDNLCVTQTCCLNNPLDSYLESSMSGIINQQIGSVYPLYSVFGAAPASLAANVNNPQIAFTMGGNNILRLNSGVTGDYSRENAVTTFVVDTSNYFFSYAFVTVLCPGHGCCDAGAIVFRFTDLTTNSVIAGSSFSVMAPSSACNNINGLQFYAGGTGVPYSNTVSAGIVFNKWQVNHVNFLPYLGDQVKMEVIAADCTAGGHFGYVYLDSKAGKLQPTLNGSASLVSCVYPSTVAVDGVNNCTWAGPNGFTATGTAFTATSSGQFTLTVNQGPQLPAITKVFSITIAPGQAFIYPDSPQLCAGNSSLVLTASGLATYNWTTMQSGPSITVSPGTTTTYTVSGENVFGCPATATVLVKVNDCTSLDHLVAERGPELFPNPNKGQFILRLANGEPESEFVVTDVAGRLVFSKPVKAGENLINTGLSEGLYFYRVEINGDRKYSGQLRIE